MTKRSAELPTQRSAASLAALLCLALCSCTDRGPAPPPKPEAADYLPPEASAPETFPDVSFVDITEEAGIRFVHENGSFGKKFLPETMGSGTVLFDYDGDGLTDLFLVNGMRWPGHESDYPRPAPAATMALYRNLGGLRFEDSSARAGVAITAMGMGAAAADVDQDGDLDLFITAVGRYLFLRNLGGKFADETEAVGLTAPTWTDKKGRKNGSWGTTPAFLDYDRDGRVDLFVANYVRWSEETDIFFTWDGHHKAFTTPEPYEGDTCRLYRNVGGRFEDVTEKAGILRPEGKSLGVAIEDVDDDRWIDILVSNDTQPNFFFRNNGDGTFTEKALVAGIAYSPDGRARAGMGIDTCREPGTQALAIAIGNFSREPLSFYREIKEGFFQDDNGPAGLGPPTNVNLTFGVLFLDYDLDGRSDVCLANGHIEPSIQEVFKEISFAEPAQLFINRGKGRFTEASKSAGPFFSRQIVGRGLATGDLDGDGDLDLVFTTNGGQPHLLRCDNRTSNRFLCLKLRSKGSATEALGARVSVEAGGATQRRTVRTGSSYLSQSDLALTFGMGSHAAAEKIEVRWPDGKVETFQNVPTSKAYLIEEGKGELAAK